MKEGDQEMRIGFIGYGEAAYELSVGLSEEGLTGIVAFDPLLQDSTIGPLLNERASQASVQLLSTIKEVVEYSSLLLVAVPADKAYGVSQSIIPFLKEGTLYVDVSASTPDVKMKISNAVKSKGVEFTDAAMMGPLSVYKHKVPILASGAGTDEFINIMSGFNMNITKVSEVAGDASATKLIRSIYMKGISSLLVEMLEAASHFNVESQVIESIVETMEKSSFKETMNRLVTGTSIHSKRRSAELQGSIQMLEAANLSSVMSRATKEKLDLITAYGLREKFQGEKPESWEEVIESMTVAKVTEVR